MWVWRLTTRDFGQGLVAKELLERIEHQLPISFFGDGGYLPRPKSDGGWFTSAVKRAGVQTFTPHDLRDTCASLAALGDETRSGLCNRSDRSPMLKVSSANRSRHGRI
jgi:integrase